MIDTHVHLWRYRSSWMSWLTDRPADWDVVRRDFDWEDLKGELDQAQVGEAILMQACTTPEETAMLLRVAAEQPSVVGVVGWATLRSVEETERQLDSFEGKLVGIRNNHLWAPDGDVLAGERCIASVRLLARRGLTLDLHFPDHRTAGISLRIADAVPEIRIVVDHLGKPDLPNPDALRPWVETMTDLSRRPNVFLKHSGWATFMGRTLASDVQPYVDHALELFGPDRMLFASNWPVALVAGSYRDTFDATLDTLAGLNADELDAVMYRTARHCYLED